MEFEVYYFKLLLLVIIIIVFPLSSSPFQIHPSSTFALLHTMKKTNNIFHTCAVWRFFWIGQNQEPTSLKYFNCLNVFFWSIILN